MDEFERAYNRALRFLSFRPRSEKEILDYLKKPRRAGSRFAGKKTDSEIIEKVLEKLKEINLINDQEFTKWWIEQRTGSKPRGMRVIKMELRQKGIDDEIIEVESSKLKGARFASESEQELAKRALEKKLKAWGKFSKEVFREKATAFLVRRGFDYETAKVAIKEIFEYNQ